MSTVVAEISMSLDGFVTGPDPDLEHGLGRDGEAVHHLAPVLLGGGTPLFRAAEHRTPMQKSVRASRTATHLTYDLAPSGA